MENFSRVFESNFATSTIISLVKLSHCSKVILIDVTDDKEPTSFKRLLKPPSSSCEVDTKLNVFKSEGMFFARASSKSPYLLDCNLLRDDS